MLVFNTFFSQVEVSKGHGNSSEDFRVAATVDALDEYRSAAATTYPSSPGGAQPEVLRAVLTGLRSSSEYNVRVAAVSRCAVRLSRRRSENARLAHKKSKNMSNGDCLCLLLAVPVYKSSACGGTTLISDRPCSPDSAHFVF